MNPTQTFEVDTDELDGLDVNEEVAELDTVFVNLEKAKQAQVALESMVTILESQVLKSNSVSFANFTLETIANQVGLSAEDLKVSLEENGDVDEPGEQQPSVLQKAKGFLSSIKNTVSARPVSFAFPTRILEVSSDLFIFPLTSVKNTPAISCFIISFLEPPCSR